MPKKILIPIIILIVLTAAAAGAWYYLSNKENGEPIVIDEAKINPLDYLVFEIKKENYSEFQKEKAFAKFNDAKIAIEAGKENGKAVENLDLFYNWLEVTVAQHMIGDYEREAQILKWFTGAHPGNSVSPSNLGNLYKSFIADNAQSEKYYQIALEREKKKYDIYYGLYELYRYNFEDAEKAIAALTMGKENNPDERSYVVDLMDYYMVLGEKDKAETVLDEWLVKHPEDFSLEERLQ